VSSSSSSGDRAFARAGLRCFFAVLPGLARVPRFARTRSSEDVFLPNISLSLIIKPAFAFSWSSTAGFFINALSISRLMISREVLASWYFREMLSNLSKARCTEILRTLKSPIEITNRGKVIAVVNPPSPASSQNPLVGCLKSTVTYASDWDEPLGEEDWEDIFHAVSLQGDLPPHSESAPDVVLRDCLLRYCRNVDPEARPTNEETGLHLRILSALGTSPSILDSSIEQ